MTDNILDRGTQERIRATIDGTPDSEWDGLANATIWWVLTTDPGGGTIALEKTDSDSALTVQVDGGGADAGEITIDLTPTETEDLARHIYYQEVVVEDGDGDPSVGRLDPHKVHIVDTTAEEVRS